MIFCEFLGKVRFRGDWVAKMTKIRETSTHENFVPLTFPKGFSRSPQFDPWPRNRGNFSGYRGYRRYLEATPVTWKLKPHPEIMSSKIHQIFTLHAFFEKVRFRHKKPLILSITYFLRLSLPTFHEKVIISEQIHFVNQNIMPTWYVVNSLYRCVKKIC